VRSQHITVTGSFAEPHLSSIAINDTAASIDYQRNTFSATLALAPGDNTIELYARDLGGMTIRSEVENKDFKMTTELKNIVLKSSPASVFEIPQGYVESKNFMEIMMPAQQQQK
jgi:hypothetical protein